MPQLATDLSPALAAAGHSMACHASGRVLLPRDDGYDEARTGWNRTIDSRPGVILQARGAGDLQAAVLAAQEHEVPLVLQATGHGTLVPADQALLVKTTAMRQVQIDPHRQLARVGPGATWHEVNVAAAHHGLGSLAGRCGTVGVTGYTLGGGAGWLARTYGYAADSVVSADVVLADGTLVTADHDHHADLFWGLRGGGGNYQLFGGRPAWSNLFDVAALGAGQGLGKVRLMGG